MVKHGPPHQLVALSVQGRHVALVALTKQYCWVLDVQAGKHTGVPQPLASVAQPSWHAVHTPLASQALQLAVGHGWHVAVLPATLQNGVPPEHAGKQTGVLQPLAGVAQPLSHVVH